MYLDTKLTLTPNSTKLAKFCNALAISFKVLADVSDGVSETHTRKSITRAFNPYHADPD